MKLNGLCLKTQLALRYLAKHFGLGSLSRLISFFLLADLDGELFENERCLMLLVFVFVSWRFALGLILIDRVLIFHI